MWIDETNSIHTIAVPAEAILGDKSLQALLAVEDSLALTTIAGMNARYDEVFDRAMADAPTGPTDIVDIDVDELPYPPTYAGPVPIPGESLITTVIRFLDGVPAQWVLEAFEAINDGLDREDPDDLGDVDAEDSNP